MAARDGITVRGAARASRTPDRASVQLAVEVRAATAGDAHREAGERMRTLLSALGDLGVSGADVATQQVDLSATYDYRETGTRLTGYAARQALAVTVRDLARVAPVIDGAVAAGADQVTGVALSVADTSALLRDLRAAAVADARIRAESLAAAAGVGLGPPVAITEVADGGMPMAFAVKSEAATADTPIAPGSTEIVAEVEVVFAIIRAAPLGEGPGPDGQRIPVS
jgi:uncharacterized protein